METQFNIPERKPDSSKRDSIHYELIKTKFEHDIRDRPIDFDVCLMNAISKYFEKDFESSLAAFDHAIIMNRGKAENYYYRGLLKFALEDYPGAVNDCTLALKIKPGYIKAHTRRGVAAYQCGLFTKALEDLNYSIALDPKDGEAFFIRGIIKTTTGNQKSGMADLLHGQNLGYSDGCLIYSGAWV